MAAKNDLKASDRVRRVNGTGCVGTIKEIRQETTLSNADVAKDRPLIVSVQWDNGTFSYLSPEGIKRAD